MALWTVGGAVGTKGLLPRKREAYLISNSVPAAMHMLHAVLL